jgi:hypothetical protein
VRSYLEIGSKFGGSLRVVANALPAGSRVVAVDMPKGTKAWPQSSEALKAVIAEQKLRGLDARVIWADSQDPATVDQVRALGPFDAILIDADHRLPGVTKDWEELRPDGPADRLPRHRLAPRAGMGRHPHRRAAVLGHHQGRLSARGIQVLPDRQEQRHRRVWRGVRR